MDKPDNIYHLTREEIQAKRNRYGAPTQEEIAQARRANEELDLLQEDSQGVPLATPFYLQQGSMHIPTLGDKLIRIAEYKASLPPGREDLGKWDLRSRVARIKREKLSVVDPWD